MKILDASGVHLEGKGGLPAALTNSASRRYSPTVGFVQSTQINSVAGSKISGAIPAASLPTGSGNCIQNCDTGNGCAAGCTGSPN